MVFGEAVMNATHRRKPNMTTPKSTTALAQLPLPFHPPVTAPMNEQERETLRQSLAQLLLEAAGLIQEGSNDGQ
jgi:hypothetical protein